MNKRILSQLSGQSPNKKTKVSQSNNYFLKTLCESGINLKYPPAMCIATKETIHIIRHIKKNLEKHLEYPRNISDFFSEFTMECKDLNVFKHYLFPNIVRLSEDSGEEFPTTDSVIKILLNVPILQNKLTDYIFEKAIDLAAAGNSESWIQMILKCFSSLDSISNTEKMSVNLINLMDVTDEKMVKLEIITAIPDIIGDQEHDNIATEMSRILSDDYDLIPAILDCLSYLCLTDAQYEELQKKTLNLLMTLTKFSYFPNFVKFLLLPGRTSNSTYFEAVQGLRSALDWPTTEQSKDIATSQVLTATAIRNSMVSSKLVSNCWLKVISSCKVHSDYKPIDFTLFIILYSTSEEKKNQVEKLIRKHIKGNILKKEVIKKSFIKFKSILKEYLSHLISLTNSLLKTKSDPIVEDFASHIYTLMFEELEECCSTIVAELLHLGLDSKQYLMSILLILNNVALKDISLLRPLSIQMLTLLDRMDDMPLMEVRGVMNLLCGLAYSTENSVIRDDIHMIIRKELGSSSPNIKIQGILAAIHAVKYLMVANSDDVNTEAPNDASSNSIIHLPEGDIREAAQIIELISCSTRQFPDMIPFFYDELAQIIFSSANINKNFLAWLTDAVTNDLQQKFIVDSIEDGIDDFKITMQYGLNTDSEIEEVIAINIAELTIKRKSEIRILPSLLQLVQTLHSKQSNGDLSGIDALLGCPVVLPKFNLDTVEELNSAVLITILDCLFYCVNWFRELVNAFAPLDDEGLKNRAMVRLLNIEEIEMSIKEILLNTKISYKPPVSTLNVNKYTGEQSEKKPVKLQSSKQKTTKISAPDDTVLPETLKSQATQSNASVKNCLEISHNLPLRPLNLNVLHLIKTDLTNEDSHAKLTIKTLNFLLKCVHKNIEDNLISRIKKKTFLTKQETVPYDAAKAEKCAKAINSILPILVEHLKFVTHSLDRAITDNQDGETLFTSAIMNYLTCLEYIYSLCTYYFKWIGFKNKEHDALLKSSLQTLGSQSTDVVTIKDLIIAVAQFLQKHEKYCLQLSTAVSLIEFLHGIQYYSEHNVVFNILRKTAENFLSKQWKTPDNNLEKGTHFTQSIDRLAFIYFINIDILTLKNLTLELMQEIKLLKSRPNTLSTFKSFNKMNFSILYRNLGNAVYNATTTCLEKGLTNSEHLELWKDVTTILKNMSEMAKFLETRNNLAVFFKKAPPILKLFESQGIPIIELQLKTDTEKVLEILKILQHSTRFLQILCCHSRLKKDTVLMTKVPHVRQLLDTLVFKVKAALAANKCSEAFWMGNLKNKGIHGEVIASQEISDDDTEECEEELPGDENTDSDDEMINPEFRSSSDMV